MCRWTAEFVGPTPKRSEPRIRQVFVRLGRHLFQQEGFRPPAVSGPPARRKRSSSGRRNFQAAREEFYICILSVNRMVYKGMLTAPRSCGLLPDLKDPNSPARWRWSTAGSAPTPSPAGELAHPFRYLAHNGEINTLRGNRNWMRARYGSLQSEASAMSCRRCSRSSPKPARTRPRWTTPPVPGVNGRSLPHAVLMLIPEAWQNNDADGPGSEGVLRIPRLPDGAVGRPGFDRLHQRRPSSARCWTATACAPAAITSPRMTWSSWPAKWACCPIEPERVARKWRLQPGQDFPGRHEAGPHRR
jgi:glutamate synthase domain-containing protein 1